MTTDEEDSVPAPTETQINELRARIATLEQTVAEMSRRASSRGLRSKFRPNLWIFEQYPPRDLTLADRRHAGMPAAPQSGSLPSIAIVTPSLNQGPYIDFTIESVVSQNYPCLSHRVQDGGSTDSTLSSLRRHEGAISWQSAPDRGQAHAINLGFAAGSADVMGYLNSDDILLPGALAYVGAFFRDHPKVDLVYSHRIFIDRFGMEIGRAILPRHDPVAIKWADYIPQETMFWRRRVWDEIGPIDESYRYAMDWDFILRAQAGGFRFQRLPAFIAAFRVHGSQKTSANRELGEVEQMRLRQIHLGFLPSNREIHHALRPYLRRHIVHTRLYRLGLLNY